MTCSSLFSFSKRASKYLVMPDTVARISRGSVLLIVALIEAIYLDVRKI